MDLTAPGGRISIDREESYDMNIAKIMIPKVCTIVLHESNTVRQGLEVLSRCRYTAIPVLDGQGRYMGSVSEGDFLHHIMKVGSTELREQERYRISELVRKDFCPALNIEAEFDVVVQACMRQNFVPVVDDRNTLCGIVTRQKLIGAMAEACEQAKSCPR